MHKKNSILSKNLNKNNKSIENLYYQNLIKDSYSHYNLDNSFIVFTSINNILYLIYSTKNLSIISYNLIDNIKINEIKNAHEMYITNFRHYSDGENKRDLFISISSENNNIKLWNINNWELLYNYESINKVGELYSACFLQNNSDNFIITSNSHLFNTENIKVFDFYGNKLNEINESNYNTFIIETYFDKKSKINYIITGNYGYITSFDFQNNKFYQKYDDGINTLKRKMYNHFFIYETEGSIKIISSGNDGNIRIWEFHSSNLLIKLKIVNKSLGGICFFCNENLYCGCEDTEIKIIDIKIGKIIKCLKGHYKEVINIKKINHPKYKECLISQGLYKDYIKIWIKKN